MSRPVIIMAGGTGGHIFPGLAVAEALAADGVPVVWLGSRVGLENRIVPAHGYPLETLAVAGLRGRGWRAALTAPWSLLRALAQAMKILRRHQPRSVLSMGGFAAGPGGIAAWLLRKPLLVHEQNTIPGYTNRILARFAVRVMTGFPDVFGARGEYLGNPVRAEIAALPEPSRRLAARAGRRRLLVLGGSQGAGALNRVLPAALARIDPAARPEVRHQAGGAHQEPTRAAYAQAGVEARIYPFIDDMAEAYAWADLVVCRAGALTVAELAACGIGALLIPYPHAVDDHQRSNAEFLVAAGAAELIPEDRLSPESLAERLGALLGDQDALAAMAVGARRRARPRAAADVAQRCLEVAPA